jgi:two-component system phosphate regulon sensor histidine kinase PhoR
LQYDFLNNLTHEFKTPVSVIKIAANNMKSKSELTTKEKDLYVRILDEEADKLNDLMNKLLSLTQLENRSLKVNIEEIDLGQLFMEFKESYQLKYPDFQISYELNQINTIYSDKVLLISLFQNLFDNAYKYSQVNQRYLNIIVERRKQQIAFRFVDKGVGIVKSEQKNVFKKFYRIENQFNQNGSVGIGLAFCKEVANFLAGDIQVKSEPGMGSEFIVSLPFNYNELVTKS